MDDFVSPTDSPDAGLLDCRHHRRNPRAVPLRDLGKARKLPGEHVFRASRWSQGNRLLPPQVVITQESITLYQPQWIGKIEESIHMAHVSSIKIDTHLLFSDVFIETTGGRDPIVCHGHTKGDAVEMKQRDRTVSVGVLLKARTQPRCGADAVVQRLRR